MKTTKRKQAQAKPAIQHQDPQVPTTRELLSQQFAALQPFNASETGSNQNGGGRIQAHQNTYQGRQTMRAHPNQKTASAQHRSSSQTGASRRAAASRAYGVDVVHPTEQYYGAESSLRMSSPVHGGAVSQVADTTDEGDRSSSALAQWVNQSANIVAGSGFTNSQRGSSGSPSRTMNPRTVYSRASHERKVQNFMKGERQRQKRSESRSVTPPHLSTNVSQMTGTTSQQRKWNQYIPQIEKMWMEEVRKQSPSPFSMRQGGAKRKMKPKEVKKQVKKLSVPIDRPMVERDVPPNDKEHHDLFQAFLRDPSPITSERAKIIRAGKVSRNSGSVTQRLSNGRFNRVGSLANSTLLSERSHNVTSRYMQTFEERQSKLTEECNFKPNLSLTQRFHAENFSSAQKSQYLGNSQSLNSPMENEHVPKNDRTFVRNQKWIERKNQKIAEGQAQKAQQGKADLTFRPAIKNMVSESAIAKEHLTREQLRALTPEITIPSDTQQSRLVFKSVPGMTKFLQRQYKGMIKREEQKLAQFNLGKTKEQRKTLDQMIKADFAYKETDHYQGVHGQASESQGGPMAQQSDNGGEELLYSSAGGPNFDQNTYAGDLQSAHANQGLPIIDEQPSAVSASFDKAGSSQASLQRSGQTRNKGASLSRKSTTTLSQMSGVKGKQGQSGHTNTSLVSGAKNFKHAKALLRDAIRDLE